MKKQEMIKIIKAQEQELYNDLQECIKKLGMNDPITDAVVARWAIINQLVKTLGL